MTAFNLFPDMLQLFVIVLSDAGRVAPYPNLLKALILQEHGFDFPGIGKAAKIIVHVKRDPLYFRVAFQKRGQRHMGGASQG